MSISEMQACLGRLYVDDSFRKLFWIDARTALQGYRLTDEEFIAVTGVDRQMVEFFAASLKKKRRKRFQRAYPMLFKLNAGEIDRYYHRYYELHTLHRTNSANQDISDFGIFMEESLANNESFPPYASDLVRYERLYYSAATASATGDLDDRDDAQGKMVKMDARPRLQKGVQVALVAYDIPRIQEAAEQGSDPGTPELLEGDYAIVFRPLANSPTPGTLRLNGAAKTVLVLCDGQRTVSQIVIDTQERLNVQGLQQGVVNTIERLIEGGVLTA